MGCTFVCIICTITFSCFYVNTHWPLSVLWKSIYAHIQHLFEEDVSVLLINPSGEPTVQLGTVNPLSVLSVSEFEAGGVISSGEFRPFVPREGRLTALLEV